MADSPGPAHAVVAFDVEGADAGGEGAPRSGWPSSAADTDARGEREQDPLLSSSPQPDSLTAPSGRSAGGDILAGLRALTYDPLKSVVRAGGGAVASVMPQGLKDGLRSGADGLKDGLSAGADFMKDGFMRTGEALASVMPQDLKDGLRTGAVAAQRGAQMAADAAVAGAVLAKDAAVEGAGVVISVLPQEFRDVANVSREAVEKLAEASRAVERLLKDKAWRNYGGVKKGKKVRTTGLQRSTRSLAHPTAVLQLLPGAPGVCAGHLHFLWCHHADEGPQPARQHRRLNLHGGAWPPMLVQRSWR